MTTQRPGTVPRNPPAPTSRCSRGLTASLVAALVLAYSGAHLGAVVPAGPLPAGATDPTYAPLVLSAKIWPTRVLQPGQPCGLESTLHNPTAHAIHGSWATPEFAEFHYLAVRGSAGASAPTTRACRWWGGLPVAGIANGRLLDIPAGGSFRYPLRVFPSRSFDLTVPGVYWVRLGISARLVLSKWIKVRVAVPRPAKDGVYLPLAGAVSRTVKWGPPWRGISMMLIPLWHNQKEKFTARPADIRFRVELANLGRRPVTLRLCGLPLLDFRQIAAVGPQRTVMKFRSGKQFNLRNKPVPLTAYGRQLAAHPRRPRASMKDFVLAPHCVYSYAEVLRPEAVRDMTLAGQYKLRIGLSGTGCKSAWIKVLVPYAQ